MRLRLFSVSAAFLSLCCVVAQADGRERVRIDAGWRFHLGDFEGPEPGLAIGGWQWKAVEGGRRQALAAIPKSLDDTKGWQAAGTEDVFHGRRGFAWYRAALPAAGRRYLLHFENVDDNATVFLDGRRVGSHNGWGTPFDIDLKPALTGGGPHVVAVLVENTNAQGGINGPVSLRLPMAENPPAAIRPDYNDKSWRALDLPHDFVVEGTFDQKADGSHGFLPAGVGWYRKSFTLPVTDRGKRIFLDFDGIYRDSDIWINGKHAASHPSGYTSFRVDATPFVRPGAKNSLVVRADARHFEGWWYEGGGIYRHVWLVKTDPVHVAHWGTYVTSTAGPDPANPATADINIQTDVSNDSGSAAECEIRSQIVDPRGRKVAEIASGEKIGPGMRAAAHQRVRIASPLLWSVETPRLYRLVTTVMRGGRSGQVVDRYVTPFGIRTVRFDAAKGFFLNGRPVKLKGTCNHQDFAGVGVALPDRLQEYKVQRLREMGSNAFRMSHNPPAPELLEACDRLGMLVMDENRHLGDTYTDHTPSGTPYSDLGDLKDLLLRDRNHPSIVMWSMCNEEGLQGTAEGARIFQAMKDVTRRLDPTRPVTCAMNGGWGQGISLVEDLQGCNYNPGGYDAFHQRFPTLPAYGSETASTVSTRGVYANDKEKGYVSAYDVNAPPWAQIAEVAWPAIADREWMAGSYAWTGFDYRGEPTPYYWPCVNSHFGIMDTCGFAKDNYYYYQANWTDRPVVHLLPHWNWPGREGQPFAVWCYSNCDSVELFLNGRSLGRKTVDREKHVEWDVPYTPGKIEARGYGKREAVTAVETTGAPAAIVAAPWIGRSLVADGEDSAAIAVSVQDDRLRDVPTADNLIRFRVEGPGRIIGVGNGDPSSHERDKASQRHAFNGKCMVIVQSTGQPGTIRLIAESAGLKPAIVSIAAVRGSKSILADQ